MSESDGLHPVGQEDLMRYMDDEVSGDRRGEIELHVESCTECARELRVFRMLGAGLSEAAPPPPRGRSVWSGVSRRLERPLGWALFVGGLLVWLVYAIYVYLSAPLAVWEKLVNGAIFIGIAILLGSVLREHYTAWRRDPYRHIQR